MQARQFRAHRAHPDAIGLQLMAERATVFLESRHFVLLLQRSAALGHLGCRARIREQADAALEIAAGLLASGREPKLPRLPQRVA